MTGYQSKRRRSLGVLSLSFSLLSLLFTPLVQDAEAQNTRAEAQSRERSDSEVAAALDQEPLRWAEIIFLRNRAQLLRENREAQRANVADKLNVGDALRTLRRSRAELRFNDESLARIGERATFQFTPNTRNFQLTNGTVLLIIPPSRGRTTIQTPNATTGIQGSALFVRYIPETDTTIVGALTDNPNGPMVLFNEDGTEQQALRANEIGVIEGDRITELYQFDSELFWESSALAEGFDYAQDSPTGSDALDPVRQEIRDAISKQEPIPENDERVIENPESFSRPSNAPSEETDGENTDTEGVDSSDKKDPETNTSSREDSGEATAENSDADNADSGEANSGEDANDTSSGSATQPSTGSSSTGSSSTGGSSAGSSSAGSSSTGSSSTGGSSAGSSSAGSSSAGSSSAGSSSAGSSSAENPAAGGASTAAPPNGGQPGGPPAGEGQANSDSGQSAAQGSVAGGPVVNSSATDSSVAGGSDDSSTGGTSPAVNPPVIEEGSTADNPQPAISNAASSVGSEATSEQVPTSVVESTAASEEPSIESSVESGVDPVTSAAEEEAAAEPVVNIQFEGTPAQEYLSIPQSQVQVDVPDIGENNSLVPADTNETHTGSNDTDNETVTTVGADDPTDSGEDISTTSETDSEAATTSPPEKLPDDIDEQVVGVDLDTPVSAVDDLQGAGLQAGENGANAGDDTPTDPTAEVLDETGTPAEDPPTDAEPPVIPESPEDPAAPTDPVVLTNPPVLPEDVNPDVAEPVLPEGANPDVAEPILPTEPPADAAQPLEDTPAELIQAPEGTETPGVETPEVELIETSDMPDEAVELPDIEELPDMEEAPDMEMPEVEPPEADVPDVEVVEPPEINEVPEVVETPAEDALEPVDTLVEVIDEGSQVEEIQVEDGVDEPTGLDAGEEVMDTQPPTEDPATTEVPILL